MCALGCWSVVCIVVAAVAASPFPPSVAPVVAFLVFLFMLGIPLVAGWKKGWNGPQDGSGS